MISEPRTGDTDRVKDTAPWLYTVLCCTTVHTWTWAGPQDHLLECVATVRVSREPPEVYNPPQPLGYEWGCKSCQVLCMNLILIGLDQWNFLIQFIQIENYDYWNSFSNCTGLWTFTSAKFFCKMSLDLEFKMLIYQASYSGRTLFLYMTLLCLYSWLLSISGCSNAYDTNLGSHTHYVLPISATEIIVYGHRTSGNSTIP